jgi:hypothetical protein
MDKIKSKQRQYSLLLALILTSSLVKSQDFGSSSTWIRDSMICYDTLSLFNGGVGNHYFCETNSDYRLQYEFKSDTLVLWLLKPNEQDDINEWARISEYWYKLDRDNLLRLIYFEDLTTGYKTSSSGGEPFKKVKD